MLTDVSCFYERRFDNLTVTCIVTGEEWRQNTYLVLDVISKKCILIDPGDNVEMISDRVLQQEGTLQKILLTHPHHDHVGGAAFLSKRFNVTCALHSADVRLLKHAPTYAKTFTGRKISPVENYHSFEEFNSNDDDILIRSLHTPGHTKGSVCYLFKGFTFTGDTLMYRHYGRTDLPGGNSTDILESISFLLNELPDDNVLFSGHGRPWSVGEAKAWWREIDSSQG